MFTYVLLAIVGLVVLLFLLAGVKIVRPYERGIVERLGKYKETSIFSGINQALHSFANTKHIPLVN